MLKGQIVNQSSRFSQSGLRGVLHQLILSAMVNFFFIQIVRIDSSRGFKSSKRNLAAQFSVSRYPRNVDEQHAECRPHKKQTTPWNPSPLTAQSVCL